MAGKKPLNKIVIKNRASYPVTLKRAKSGMEYLINPFGGVGVDVFKTDGFIGVDFDARVIYLDTGDEDD